MPKLIHDKASCMAAAAKHTRKTEWFESDRASYQSARRNGWLEECAAHMTGNIRWTKEKVLAIASQYPDCGAFRREQPKAFMAMREGGHLEACSRFWSGEAPIQESTPEPEWPLLLRPVEESKGIVRVITPREPLEWEGMPEFIQVSDKPFKEIKIRFESEESYLEFAKLIEQNLSSKTKSIWYPKYVSKPRGRWVDQDNHPGLSHDL